jgi:hypothetical protein
MYLEIEKGEANDAPGYEDIDSPSMRGIRQGTPQHARSCISIRMETVEDIAVCNHFFIIISTSFF